MKRQINVRLSEVACELLVRLAAESYGDISQGAVLEVLLRAEAERQGLVVVSKPPPKPRKGRR